MNDDQHFDNILDETLSEYRDAEPLAGLEHRVLKRLSAQSGPRRQSCLRWTLAAAGVAILLAAVGLILQSRHPPAQREFVSAQPISEPSTVASQSETKAAPKLKIEASPPLRTEKTTASPPPITASVPVQQFPTPVKTTIQEQALAMIATTHPDALAASSHDPQLIAISPLVITPLASVNQPLGED